MIRRWFLENHPWLSTTDPRTDYYLYLPDRVDLGIKLREGNVEVKHRISNPAEGQLGKNSKGYFEDWIKWSFKLADGEMLGSEIINNHKYVFQHQLPIQEQLLDKSTQWIEIKKVRIGLKISLDKNGNINYFHIKDFIDDGCQVEYTKIEVLNTTWYTFGFEWFGKPISFKDSFFDKILGGTRLKLENSYGYAKFLSILNKDWG